MSKEFLSNLIIKKVFSASSVYNNTNAKAKRIDRSCWAIIIKYEGETIYKVNGKRYISNKNNLVILPKGCSYEWLCTKSGYFSIIEFDCDSTSDDIFTFNIKDGEKILKIFKKLEYKRTFKSTTCDMECIRDCYSIIISLIQSSDKYYSPSHNQQKIAPALEYIAKNYTKNTDNDELAAITGFSTVHFRKLFTETMGSSPQAYIHKLRIKKAKEMLKSDYSCITDIAYSLGYLSIYDFSRTFKKYTGVPPSKYS